MFVAAAFVLGLITKCYRDKHPSPTPVQTHPASSRASVPSRAKIKQPDALNTGEAAAKIRRKT